MVRSHWCSGLLANLSPTLMTEFLIRLFCSAYRSVLQWAVILCRPACWLMWFYVTLRFRIMVSGPLFPCSSPYQLPGILLPPDSRFKHDIKNLDFTLLLGIGCDYSETNILTWNHRFHCLISVHLVRVIDGFRFCVRYCLVIYVSVLLYVLALSHILTNWICEIWAFESRISIGWSNCYP